jgi:hypothetical protein
MTSAASSSGSGGWGRRGSDDQEEWYVLHMYFKDILESSLDFFYINLCCAGIKGSGSSGMHPR